MKLKNLVNGFILLFFISACGDAKKEEANQTALADTTSVENSHATAANVTNSQSGATAGSFFGAYVGAFVADKADEKKAPMYLNRITISVDSANNGMLFGYSVVAGNKRPFKGKYSISETTCIAEVKEPGDDKYDGSFTFTITSNPRNLSGTWTANNLKLAVSKRNYSLASTIFEYNPGQQGLEINGSIAVYNPATGEQYEGEMITPDAGKINASLQVLKESDVENMYKRDLEVMRNSIYARHGYSFKNREMRYFFDTEVDWYIPYSTNVTKELSDIEKKNIELIKRYEDHATSYYDSFGR